MNELVPPVRRKSRTEALGEFYQAYREALLRGEDWTGETHNRTALQQGLACMLTALREDLSRSGQRTLGPCTEMAFNDLALALLDLAEGKSPALLQPGEQHQFDQSKRSPESDGHALRNLKHVALGAVQILLCRSDVNKGLARDIVARALTEAGVSPRKRVGETGRISSEIVRSWERVAKDLPLGRPLARIPLELQIKILIKHISLEQAELELVRMFKKLAGATIR